MYIYQYHSMKNQKNDGHLVLQINNPYYIEIGTFKHVIKSS